MLYYINYMISIICLNILLISSVQANGNQQQTNQALTISYLKSDGFFRIVTNITEQNMNNDVYCKHGYGLHYFYDGTSDSCVDCAKICNLLENKYICVSRCSLYLYEFRINKTLQLHHTNIQALDERASKHFNVNMALHSITFALIFFLIFALYYMHYHHNPKHYYPYHPAKKTVTPTSDEFIDCRRDSVHQVQQNTEHEMQQFDQSTRAFNQPADDEAYESLMAVNTN